MQQKGGLSDIGKPPENPSENVQNRNYVGRAAIV
jgi:hypothetical protein